MEHYQIMKNWGGELDYVDNQSYRQASFDAWLSWEFLQRTFAGCHEELKPSEMGKLCGKTSQSSRQVHARVLKKARLANNSSITLNV